MKRTIGIAILAIITGACSATQDHPAKRELTEAQRDSVISKSDLPGAGVVGRALSESGRQQRQADAVNRMVDSLPH